MLRHDGLALKHMGDGVIQSLIIQSGDMRLTNVLNRRQKFLQRP